jgi:hypothetical protein
LFERLIRSDDWSVRVDSVLGLAELSPDGKVDIERIASLPGETDRDTAITAVLALKLADAEQVRSMFQLYLRLGSAAEVATRVNALGWTRKQAKPRAGHVLGGGPWDEKDVHMLLRNPLYIGKVDFKTADGASAAAETPSTCSKASSPAASAAAR